jgi:SprT protein
MIQLVINKKEYLDKIIKDKFNKCLNIEINLDLKSIRNLGLCEMKRDSFIIHLNRELLFHYKEKYVDEVFTHEYAHAVVKTIFGNRVKPHGKEFKYICSILGIEGKAKTNSFSEFKGNFRKSEYRWVYKCDCTEHTLSTKRHNKIKKLGNIYRCTKCKEILHFHYEISSIIDQFK